MDGPDELALLASSSALPNHSKRPSCRYYLSQKGKQRSFLTCCLSCPSASFQSSLLFRPMCSVTGEFKILLLLLSA